MRIYVPLTAIFDNPYQVRQNYGDIADFAENEILPFLSQRPDTLGLQVPPQARIVDTDGRPLENWHTVLVKAGAAVQALPELDTKRAQLENAWWGKLSASAQLIFGHRRLRALRHLAESDPRFSVVPLDIVQLDDAQMLAEVYGENSFRKNTAAVEDLELMRHAFALLGDDATLSEVASLLGMSRPRASNLWRLRHASEALAEANREGILSQSHLEELIKLERILPHMAVTDDSASHYSAATVEDFDPHAQWLAAPAVALEAFMSGRFGRGDIRLYMDRLAGKSGRVLIAEHNDTAVPLTDMILQETCKQCPAKINQHCYNSPCYDAKAIPVARAYAAAHAPDIPWSDNPDHFAILGGTMQEHVTAHPDDDKLVLGFLPLDVHSFRLKINGEAEYFSKYKNRQLVPDRIVYGRSEPLSRDDVVAERSGNAPRPMLEPRDEEPTAEEVWLGMWYEWLGTPRDGVDAMLMKIGDDVCRQLDKTHRTFFANNKILSPTIVMRKLKDNLYTAPKWKVELADLVSFLPGLRDTLAPLGIAVEPSAEILANSLVMAYADVFAGERDYDPGAEPFGLHDEIMTKQNEIPFDTVRLLIGARQLVTEKWQAAREELAIA